jgi:hypothetical protein
VIFTAAQVRAIRQHKQTAALMPRGEPVRTGSVRVLRRCEVTARVARRPAPRGAARDVLAWIEARLDLDPTVEIVSDVGLDGERVAVPLTILAVQDVAIDGLTLADARACGWRTTGQLRAAWRLEHPQSVRARLVSFALGDLRDAPVLLSRGWPDYTRDPSRAMFAEPEPVDRREQTRLGADARQRYLALQAGWARERAALTMSERLAAIRRGTVAPGGTGA